MAAVQCCVGYKRARVIGAQVALGERWSWSMEKKRLASLSDAGEGVRLADAPLRAAEAGGEAALRVRSTCLCLSCHLCVIF